MHPNVNSSWLQIGVDQDQVFVRDHGRLGRMVSELARPDQQHPTLSIFLGGKTKDTALRYLFPYNNISRTRAHAGGISLRMETLSAETGAPLLFADGDIGPLPHTGPSVPGDHLLPCQPSAALPTLYTRLIFPFVDLICIFADDFGSLALTARFVVDCVTLGSISCLPVAARPKIIVMLEKEGPTTELTAQQDIALFYRTLNEVGRPGIQQSFSAVNLMLLGGSLSETVRYEQLRTSLKDQQEAMYALRGAYRYSYNARHLESLFRSALLSLTSGAHFNLVQATRQDRPIARGMGHHLSHFWRTASHAGCSLDTLVQMVASALIMDHYLPGMMLLEPRTVFHTFYYAPVTIGCQGYGDPSNRKPISDLVARVELEFVSEFHLLCSQPSSAVDRRRKVLISLSHELGRVRSHTICLYCLVRSAQHCHRCSHAVCDLCAQLFGSPAADAEYRFTLSMCLLCLSQDELVVEVLPPTMSPTILAIDGGGVRGVIPLEYLLLIQESLGPGCHIRDFVDLAMGASSGGLITLGLIGMGWDVSTCSQMFDRLARRIFRERRQPPLSWLARLVFGQNSMIGQCFQWLSWFVHDSCYDTQIFNSSLREAFHEDHSIFGGVSPSGCKFGVVATTISKDTKSFVFGNFNAVDWFSGNKHEYELFRATDTDKEPLISEVAGATAAAPFYFSTATLGRTGSFQDGGLKDNFAADLARRVSRRIWPSKTRLTRLISLGTGIPDSPPNPSPHFRHFLVNGFLRRTYDAFMSQMDTASKWVKMKNDLDEDIRQDYLRFDVPLRHVPCTIDDANMMDDYRNLVVSLPGSGRRAREAATALLVGRFYFVLEETPRRIVGSEYAWYNGTIRCKGPVKQIVAALETQHSHQRLDFMNDGEHLTTFSGMKDLCPACRRYCKPVSLFLRHSDQMVNIYLQLNRQKRWRISGFPATMSSFLEAQNFNHAFGRPDHGLPGAVHCEACAKTCSHGRRRKRAGSTVDEQAKKRLCIVNEVQT